MRRPLRDPTLHQRIGTEISERILSGAWPPGHRIPAEHELMAQFGCARMTVNKALAALAQSGLIERRKRAGTFVARPRVHAAVLSIPDIQAEVTARGQTYDYELILRRKRLSRVEEAALLGLDAVKPVLVLRCLHRAGGRPFALEDRLINLAATPEAAEADFEAQPPGGWLLARVPWTEAEHRISAVSPSPEQARLLEIAPAAACLLLERRTWRGDERITHVRQLFPGEAYDLVARFRP